MTTEKPATCPFYDVCTERLGDELEHNITCTSEVFYRLPSGVILCAAWDITLPIATRIPKDINQPIVEENSDSE